MATEDKLLIIGDVHGDYEALWTLLNKYKDECIFAFQTGDLGLYDSIHHAKQDGKAWKHNEKNIVEFIERRKLLKPLPVPLMYIKGNHDNYNNLWAFRDLDIFYIPQGTALLYKKFAILGLGGIYSSKRSYKSSRLLKGRELRFYTIDNINTCKETSNSINSKDREVILLTHEAARGIMPLDKRGYDQGTAVLKEMLDSINPAYYIHGHHHVDYEVTYNNTKVFGLGDFKRTGTSYLVINVNEDKPTITHGNTDDTSS